MPIIDCFVGALYFSEVKTSDMQGAQYSWNYDFVELIQVSLSLVNIKLLCSQVQIKVKTDLVGGSQVNVKLKQFLPHRKKSVQVESIALVIV